VTHVAALTSRPHRSEMYVPDFAKARYYPEGPSNNSGPPPPDAGMLSNAAWLWIGIGVSIVGLWCFSFQLRNLWHIWTTDGLRSIGILILPTSLILSFRAWHGHQWEGGSWCGLTLAIVCAAVAALPLSSVGLLLGYASRSGVVNFFPTGLWLWGYVSGVVILLGGVRAWRKAALPLALLLFVNPVPSAFTNLVDLPLQHLGALAARNFAGWVGISVSGKGEDLWLYFAPGYGMFIASACNGLRSAVTMGYLAVVVGYLYGLPKLWHVAYAIGAVLLAFVLNSARLCCLVLLNRLALGIPFLYQALEHEATWIDYLMYVPIFFVVVFFLLRVPRLVAPRVRA
jgi:exosortase J